MSLMSQPKKDAVEEEKHPKRPSHRSSGQRRSGSNGNVRPLTNSENQHSLRIPEEVAATLPLGVRPEFNQAMIVQHQDGTQGLYAFKHHAYMGKELRYVFCEWSLRSKLHADLHTALTKHCRPATEEEVVALNAQSAVGA